MSRTGLHESALLAAAMLLLVGCDASTALLEPTEEPSPAPYVGDAVAGRAAFDAECSGCHASGDGFDLARFGFPDSTIVRRAVAHVDTATAFDIVAHVRSLGVAADTRDTRIFQVPRADSDLDFALRLFGADVWPELGEADLLALEPATIAAAIDFPLWSDEESNLDWMPDTPLHPAILGPPDGVTARALDAYHATPTDLNFARVGSRLRRALRDPATGPAPCAQEEDGVLADPAVCFEASRWVASLAASHVLRTDLSLSDGLFGGTGIQDTFWDVGQAARRGLLKNGTPVPNAQENWVSWMYLGWVFAPGNHASVYTASGLAREGLVRHATFVAMRSQADRPAGSPSPYEDLVIAASAAPASWLPQVYASGLSVLETREERGWAPTLDEAREKATTALDRAAAVVRRRLGPVAAAGLIARTQSLEAFASSP